MSKNINTFAAGLLALTSIAAASVGCQPQASEQTAANPTEFVEQTETVDATETEAASTFELTEEPTEEPTAEPVETPTEPTEEPVALIQGYKFFKDEDGYSILVQGKRYPLGDINVQEIQIEKGVCLYLAEGGKITQVIFPKKSLQFTCIKACESEGEVLILKDQHHIVRISREGKILTYEAKDRIEIDSAYFVKIGNEVKATDEILWKPMF